MGENEYDNQYKKTHSKRIRHLLISLSNRVQSGSRIGIIGYSIFDSIIREEFPTCTVYNILPSTEFKRQEATSPRQILVHDITSNKTHEIAFVFDYIIFTEVLEHLFSEDSLVINNLEKLLKRNGLLFFSVPNVSALGKLIFLLVGENPYMKKSEIIEGAFGGFGHIREYSFREVRNLLTNNFRIISLEGWNDYPNIFNRIAKFLPRVYAETIFAICQKL